jgi:hypothetical protein
MLSRATTRFALIAVIGVGLSGCGGEEKQVTLQNIELTITGINGYNGPSSISSQKLDIEASTVYFY